MPGLDAGSHESHLQAQSSLPSHQFPAVGTRRLGQKDDGDAKDPLFSDKDNSVLHLGAVPVVLWATSQPPVLGEWETFFFGRFVV